MFSIFHLLLSFLAPDFLALRIGALRHRAVECTLVPMVLVVLEAQTLRISMATLNAFMPRFPCFMPQFRSVFAILEVLDMPAVVVETTDIDEARIAGLVQSSRILSGARRRYGLLEGVWITCLGIDELTFAVDIVIPTGSIVTPIIIDWVSPHVDNLIRE